MDRGLRVASAGSAAGLLQPARRSRHGGPARRDRLEWRCAGRRRDRGDRAHQAQPPGAAGARAAAPRMTTSGARASRGVPAAPGVAHGPYLRYERVPLTGDRRAGDAATEVTRLKTAAEVVAKSRERVADELRRTDHANEARIF